MVKYDNLFTSFNGIVIDSNTERGIQYDKKVYRKLEDISVYKGFKRGNAF